MQLIVDIVVQAKEKYKKKIISRNILITCVSICDGDKFANCCRRRL